MVCAGRMGGAHEAAAGIYPDARNSRCQVGRFREARIRNGTIAVTLPIAAVIDVIVATRADRPRQG